MKQIGWNGGRNMQIQEVALWNSVTPPLKSSCRPEDHVISKFWQNICQSVMSEVEDVVCGFHEHPAVESPPGLQEIFLSAAH